MLYKLFKKIFRKQLQAEIWGILGYRDNIKGEDWWGESGTSMSFKVFWEELFG